MGSSMACLCCAAVTNPPRQRLEGMKHLEEKDVFFRLVHCYTHRLNLMSRSQSIDNNLHLFSSSSWGICHHKSHISQCQEKLLSSLHIPLTCSPHSPTSPESHPSLLAPLVRLQHKGPLQTKCKKGVDPTLTQCACDAASSAHNHKRRDE